MQLERKRKQLADQGIALAALSYDSPEVLRHFAERVGIGYPLLADTDSKVIRAFGILNESAPNDTPYFGIPHPGEYLIGPDGKVRAKFFEQSHRDRFTAGAVLARELGADGGGAKREIVGDHLTLTSWASDEVVGGGNRFTLGLDLELPEKMHVYAPGVDGYIPIRWRMTEAEGLQNFDAEYPEAENLHLPAIGETVPVYEGKIRIVRDVMISQAKQLGDLLDADGNLVLKGSFRYQACDDKVCYIPKTIDLEWKLRFAQHDRTRAPEGLRRID